MMRSKKGQTRAKRATSEMSVKTFNFVEQQHQTQPLPTLSEVSENEPTTVVNAAAATDTFTDTFAETEAETEAEEESIEDEEQLEDNSEPSGDEDVEDVEDVEDDDVLQPKKEGSKTKRKQQSSSLLSEGSDFVAGNDSHGGSGGVSSLSGVDFEKFLFFVEFKSGYIFRQFVEFTKRVSKELPLAFTRRGISTAYCSVTRQMIANAIVRAEDLTYFYVNEKYVNLPAPSSHHFHQQQQPVSFSSSQSSSAVVPQHNQVSQEWIHIINIDTVDLVEHVKSVSKKDSLIISQRLSKPDVIQIQCCGNKTDGGIVTIRTRNYTPVSYNIVEANRRPTTCPNVTIQLSKFCNCLLSLVKSRFSKIFMRIYSEGVTIIGTSQSGSRSATFGRISNPSSSSSQNDSVSAPQASSLYNQINLSIQSVSALIKMMNFNTDGVVRIYCSTNTMARIETSIGCFGNMRVYVLDASTNNKGSSNGSGLTMVSSTQHYKKYTFGC